MPTLQFKGKTAVECYHHTVAHHTLEFDPKLSVLGKGEKPGLDGNIIIEGDNLLALKALLPSHAGRIKCIYIDPPYNTGKEGWVYNDNLTQPQFKEWIGQTVGKEGEDATRHDKWCCMIYPRLQLLRQLLRDDGLIFISIDENERHHLQVLMDEIFGSENAIGSIVWKGSTENNPTLIAIEHEYILCWAKDRRQLPKEWSDPNPAAKQFMLDAYERLKAEADDLAEIQKRFRAFVRENNVACAPLTHYDRIDNGGPYTGSRKVHKPEKDGYFYDVLHPVTKIPCKIPLRGYRYPLGRMKELIDADRLIYGEDETQIIQIKEYLKDYEGALKSVITLDSRVGSNELEAIFGNREAFKGPKPVGLIKRLLSFSTEGDDIVLDSFAGSGTTGHAVLEVNREDGGTRSFVLVQMPHDNKDDGGANICRTITAERVKRIAIGYTRTRSGRGSARKEQVTGLGGSFTYALIGPPLFGEYRDFGKKLPSFEDLAKYIFYTETSRDFDAKQVNAKTGKIGEHAGSSYYLLYTPDGKQDRALDPVWLQATVKGDKNRRLVVYCEKIWIHRDDLARFEQESGRKVRPMLVPFNLK